MVVIHQNSIINNNNTYVGDSIILVTTLLIGSTLFVLYLVIGGKLFDCGSILSDDISGIALCTLAFDGNGVGFVFSIYYNNIRVLWITVFALKALLLVSRLFNNVNFDLISSLDTGESTCELEGL